MKFQILSNMPGRLRIRLGKYSFTKEEGYGISALLLAHSGVEEVFANAKNGSILIRYSEETTEKELLSYCNELKLNAVEICPPTAQQSQQEFKNEFFANVLSHYTSHMVVRQLFPLFLPNAFCVTITCVKAAKFIKDGLKSLLRGKLSVEVLDATAISSSLLSKHYSTASSIMFLLTLSDLLLEYSNRRAKNALASSLAIHVDTVWLVQGDEEISVPMSELKVGDTICVRTGNMISIDGEIVAGDAYINESTMTGEPLPVHKTAGNTVFAGTVIESGELKIKVTALENHTRISKIISMVHNEEENKALIQGKAERLADGIVPISFGLCLATFLFTRNINRAISVLMVDFSCAIKLTTPLVVITALQQGVKNNVLIKGGKYLEILDKVDTVIFDKTGTLTNAVPKVSRVISLADGYDTDKVLRIAACLEEHFPHSMAASIVAEAVSRGLKHPEEHETVEYIVAHGVASSYNGERAIIGSYHFVFDDEKVPFPEEKRDVIKEKIGADSAIYLAVNHVLVGIICVNDPPRDDAKETILALREEGISEIIMITGDGEATAKYISNELGIDRYFAAVLPDGKSKIIEELKKEGRTILMIGDGINDTPALSCANVSMTLESSSDIAREVSDISILSENLMDIVYTRRLATGLIQKISNNYTAIVGFNSILILGGIFGVVSLSQAALLHNVSTISLAALSTRTIQRR
ncbi:MAG: heavy metal translocating P-type ATPase [Bacillota bacterium]